MTGKSSAVVLCLALLTAAFAQGQTAASGPTAGLEDQATKEAYRYTSAEGDFQVTWPSGCGKLRIRANEPENFVGEENEQVVLVHLVVCDREEGEGCSVSATFEARNGEGGDAGPEQVLARVRHTLESYGVKVVKQTPIKREFADGLMVEGLDVYGTRRDGLGQFWVRGLLSYHDIYILTAWSMEGKLWEDPEIQEFFNGFVPYAE